jgi:predicted PurR-regulated permease PerM
LTVSVSPQPSQRARESALERLIGRAALRVSVIVLMVGIGALLAWRLRLILLLIAVSLFIALLLQPFVRFFQRRGLRRSYSVAVVYIVLVAIGAGFGYLVFHPVYTSATHFASDLPRLVRQAQQGRGPVGRLVRRFHLVNYVNQHEPALKNAITKLGKPALSVGKTVISGVAGLVTMAFLSFFLLLEGPKVFAAILEWFTEEHANFARRVIARMTNQVSGFMLGDFATSVVAGVVVFVALRTTNVPFASVLAIWSSSSSSTSRSRTTSSTRSSSRARSG